jgi:hypothetical protein
MFTRFLIDNFQFVQKPIIQFIVILKINPIQPILEVDLKLHASFTGFSLLGHNGGGMARAALGIAKLSADSEPIGITKHNACASRRLCYTACWLPCFCLEFIISCYYNLLI